ncbi:Spo0E like sporulation regulatory protein [Desulfosporosinus orientis DSM 765]|uniref:Spo0E like sporulation regulatory protein n=1 Tax=Desulfosporosinus orientis (strain ATCC 19365 / DSM 765 / NCIMB 8382 / VKM B-1628 / Singapore I) TaxID=768706 RepID=G7W8E9_DESOD|nr:aspartyl-phosphate phosphatase Spo0E family protein [Desulfosporosinus orientis]AET67089.1 Spo0E like sporulation regulatory protein [Desulfosporosinus orientis DSM 765]
MYRITRNDLQILLTKIEDLRDKLHSNVKQGKSIQDPLVIKLSQDLDEQLNLYYRMIKTISII